MPNILIHPNSGLIEFSTGTAGESSFNSNFTGGAFASRLGYDNYGGLNLTSYVSNITGVDRFTVDGANGRLFSVTDSLSGSLFSVNDIAGLPIIEAFDDNTVIMGAFNRNDFVLTGNSLGLGGLPNTGTTKLYVSGNALIIGNLNVTGDIFLSGNPVLTGTTLAQTGANLQNQINSLSGSLNSTGSNLQTSINNLSGYINSSSSNIVFTTGNQNIGGNKTFTGVTTFSGQEVNLIDTALNLSGVGDMTFSGTNINFINSPVLISGTNLRVNGDVLANNIVYNTGDQNIFGTKSFIGNHIISGNTIVSGSINISGNYDIYSQVENVKKLAIAYAIAL